MNNERIKKLKEMTKKNFVEKISSLGHNEKMQLKNKKFSLWERYKELKEEFKDNKKQIKKLEKRKRQLEKRRKELGAELLNKAKENNEKLKKEIEKLEKRFQISINVPNKYDLYSSYRRKNKEYQKIEEELGNIRNKIYSLERGRKTPLIYNKDKEKGREIISFKIRNPEKWDNVYTSHFFDWLLKNLNQNLNVKPTTKKHSSKSAIETKSVSIRSSYLSRWESIKSYCRKNNIQISDFLEEKLEEYKKTKH